MAKRSNGEGSVYKRKDGRWMGSMSIGRNDEGKIIRKTVYGKTKKEVILKMDNTKHELNIGSYIEPDTITIEE